MSAITTPHIRVDPRGVAWIDETNVKVIDHQAEMDAEIARQDENVRRLREEAPESPFMTRLRGLGLLS